MTTKTRPTNQRLSPAYWRKARGWWEVDGWSNVKIAEALGCSPETVRNHRKKEGWGEKGSRNPVLADPVPVSEATLEAATEAQERVAELLNSGPSDTTPTLLAQNEALQRRIAELEKETSQLRDYTTLPVFTAENIVDVMGKETFEKGVEDAMKAYHRERMRDGLPPLDRNDPDMQAMMAEIRTRLITESLEQLDKFASAGGAVEVRTLSMKWVKPGSGPASSRFRQTVLAANVNAATGQIRDNLEFYLRKGWQKAMPPRCQAWDCWKEAPTADGQMMFPGFYGGGFCSQRHVAIFKKGPDSVNNALLSVAGRQ